MGGASNHPTDFGETVRLLLSSSNLTEGQFCRVPKHYHFPTCQSFTAPTYASRLNATTFHYSFSPFQTITCYDSLGYTCQSILDVLREWLVDEHLNSNSNATDPTYWDTFQTTGDVSKRQVRLPSV